LTKISDLNQFLLTILVTSIIGLGRDTQPDPKVCVQRPCCTCAWYLDTLLTELITAAASIFCTPKWMPWEVFHVLHGPLSYHAPVVVCRNSADIDGCLGLFSEVMKFPKRVYCHNSSERCSKHHDACNIHCVRLTRKQLWQVMAHQAMRSIVPSGCLGPYQCPRRVQPHRWCLYALIDIQ
jgi:hypothetical protein